LYLYELRKAPRKQEIPVPTIYLCHRNTGKDCHHNWEGSRSIMNFSAGVLSFKVRATGVKLRSGSRDLDEEGGNNPSSPQGLSPQKGQAEGSKGEDAANEEEEEEENARMAEDLQQASPPTPVPSTPSPSLHHR